MVIGPKRRVRGVERTQEYYHWVPGSRSHCLPSKLLLCDLRDNSTCLIGWLWRLKEINHINHSEQCQAHDKHSTNVSYYCYDFLWLGPTQELAWAGITQITSKWDPGRVCHWRPPAVWWRESCLLVKKRKKKKSLLKSLQLSFLEKWTSSCKYGTCAIWVSSPVSYTIFTLWSFRIRELVDGTLEMGYSLSQVVCNVSPDSSFIFNGIHPLEREHTGYLVPAQICSRNTTASLSVWRIALLKEPRT